MDLRPYRQGQPTVTTLAVLVGGLAAGAAAQTVVERPPTTASPVAVEAVPFECPARAVRFVVVSSWEHFVRLVGHEPVRLGFDDVETSGQDDVAIEPTRYLDRTGVLLRGAGELVVDDDFGYPDEYLPASPPNVLAPRGTDAEGQLTTAEWWFGRRRACVAGVGAVFVDVDYPNLGPSSLEVLGSRGERLAEHGPIEGGQAEQVFRAIVGVGPDGRAVPAIATARFVTGNVFPRRSCCEGAVLDDLAFSIPVASVTR